MRRKRTSAWISFAHRANGLDYLRDMFTVDNNETFERLRTRGAQLLGEVVDYEDLYRLCYIRGPEGLLIGLTQELSRRQYVQALQWERKRGRSPAFRLFEC